MMASVSADATTEDPGSTPIPGQIREPFYMVQVKVDPSHLGEGEHLTPGMQASVSIGTGSRTIMDYLLGPMTEAMRTALKER